MENERSARRILQIIMNRTGMRQKDLSKETGISEATISRLLTDTKYHPTYRNYQKIVKFAQTIIKKPNDKPKEADMDYESEIDELKRRVTKLEGYLIDILAELRDPQGAAPTNRGVSR